MQAANEELAVKHAEDPSSVDIEHLDDEDAQHIEMVRRTLGLVNFPVPPMHWFEARK